ncbi:MAG TPA: aldolase [Phycisphaerales bacterium]|nr:MAG: aldolase [Planctomycetes bacterium GWC2_45_44]HBG77672.1 aldolase [Phycisphaerales bacterium]HBR20467.1 aldolase [Phycisphaerales bacterium]
MQMRSSRVLKKLRSGQVASCIKINLADPRVVEIAAMCGFDCVWLDMEHVPTDWQTIENQIRAAKIHDCDAMVRVARGSYSSHIQPLEADASGIMVPHVMSLEDAKKVVWQTRFYPVGRRAVDGGNADGAYCMVDFQEYIKTANEQRFVVVQIEDPEPLNELEAICELPGIDMIFFGPGDFSQGIGTPGKWDNPLIAQTRKRIAEVANKKGKFAGTVGGVGNLQELIDMGYRFVSAGADVVGLSTYFNPIVAAFNKSSQPQTQSQSIYGKDK